jgi:hypothetical protein
MKKHSPLNKILNRKIDQLLQGGIIQYIKANEFFHSAQIAKKIQEEEDREDPKQLTTEHLELCFYAVLIGLALSCVVFLYELLIRYLSSM